MYVFATNSLYFQFAVWSQSTRVLGYVYINCVIIIMFCGGCSFCWLVVFWILRVLGIFSKKKKPCENMRLCSYSLPIPPLPPPFLSSSLW